MDLKYIKNILLYLAGAAVSVFVIVYIVLQLSGQLGSSIETTPAVYTTEQDLVSMDGYIIRKGTLLYAQSDGSVNYYYADGDRVAANTDVAAVYDSADNRDSLIALNKKIAQLESSNAAANVATSDLTTLDGMISSLYATFLEKAEEGNLQFALQKSEELLIQLNRRRIVTKASEGFSGRIQTLSQRRDALKASMQNLTETVQTPAAGYFYSSLDGYEYAASSIDIDLMTISDFNRFTSSEPLDMDALSQYGYPIGKIVTDFAWYVACEVPYSEVHNYPTGRSYTLIFPYSRDEAIQATLYRSLTEANQDKVVLIFRTSTVPEGFNFLRRQTIEIVMNSYSGYKVPLSALRVVDGEQGVFVLDGSVVRFRRVNPLFEKNGYLIVAERSGTLTQVYKDEEGNEVDENGNPIILDLGLYELIITKGKDYYNGQIID